MKKNFFKKLSFVLALAMIVSVIAPASGVFAATNPAINTAKKYLYLGETGRNEYDFHIDNKVKGSTYNWSSADENVAVVDAKTGYTTAVAVGTTTIDCTIKTTKKTYTSETTVIVKDNIKSLSITNKPVGDKLAIGASNDFNRSFATYGGSTVKTTAITKWAVTDKDGKATTDATIDKSGVFTATKAGTYKVVAAAFQSGATFTSFTTSQDSKLVLATDTTTVTVAPSIVSIAQVDQDTLAVTFDSDMSKTDLSATTAVLYQTIAGKLLSTGTEKIKALTLDSTGKIATVDVYTSFTAGATYTFTNGDLTKSFVAATKSVNNIASIVFDDFNVSISASENCVSHVKALNSDGVVIYDGSIASDATTLTGYLTFAFSGDTTKANVANRYAYITTTGYAAEITATFNNYVLDSATSTYKAVSFSDKAIATGIKAGTLTTSSIQYEVVNDATLDTDSTWVGTLKLAAQDSGYLIQARYYTNTASTTYAYTNGTTVFTYTSSDTSKLLINGNYVFPVAEGTVTVIVKDASGATVGTFDVAISAARTLGAVTQDKTLLTVGSNVLNGEEADAVVTVLDTIGSGIVPQQWTNNATFVNYPTNVVLPTATVTFGAGTNAGKVYIHVSGKGATPGLYNMKYTATYPGWWPTKDVYFTVQVLDGTSNAAVSYWQVGLSSNSVDIKSVYDTDATLGVYGYNANGTRVAQMVNNTDYITTLYKGSDTVATGSSIIAVADGQSGAERNVMYTKGTGTYSISVALTATGAASYFSGTSVAAGYTLGAAALTVTDSTTTAVSFDNATVAHGTILAAVQNAFTFKVNDSAIDEAYITEIDYSTGSAAGIVNSITNTVLAGQSVYIQKVVIKVLDATTGSYINYTFNPGKILTIN